MDQQSFDTRTGPQAQAGSRSYPSALWPDSGHTFADPLEVIAATDLSREEKRAILAAWASDASAVESHPGLRHCPGLPGCRVAVDDVLAALQALDGPGRPSLPKPWHGAEL